MEFAKNGEDTRIRSKMLWRSNHIFQIKSGKILDCSNSKFAEKLDYAVIMSIEDDPKI
jgi:hypothetical protein